MFKKVVVILIISSMLTSCITMKVGKESPPMVDFGTPIVGHFRNKDIAKGVLYTSLFITFIVSTVLFAPAGANGQSIIPIDGTISNPIFFASIGCAGGSLVGSTIDTAVTYQIYNSKIIELNNIPWDPKGNIKKYEAINNFRAQQDDGKMQKAEDARAEGYKDTIELYRKKLIDGTITDDELALIERSEFFKENLKNELGYYTINKSKNKNKE